MRTPSFLLLSKLVITFYAYSATAQVIHEPHTETLPAQAQESVSVIHIDLNDENDGWDDDTEGYEEVLDTDSESLVIQQEAIYDESDGRPETSYTDEFSEAATAEEVETKLPGEEVNFRLKLHSSTHHFVNGKAQSDIGKIRFKSRLMPSNEVKLSLKLKQKEQDDIELIAYFDLANFTMELDGSNSVLNRDHKQVLKLVSAHLKDKFERQYRDYDFPEHVLMLVQMIGYWSLSPDGFVHEKRSIVSQ